MEGFWLFHPASLAALVALTVAGTAWAADRRRARRSDLDRVGIMPWTGIFFVALLIALLLAGFAAREWIG